MCDTFSGKLSEIMGAEREMFLSEADFQHTLAWKLHNEYPNAKIILEYPEEDPKNKEHILYYDIYFSDVKYGTHLIELKYKTKKDVIERHGKEFSLRDQAAQDLSCYYFWQDVVRMEEAAVENVSERYCIFLTNEANYWKEKDGNWQKTEEESKISYEHFKIKEGRIRSGSLNWNGNKQWMPSKKLILQNSYQCRWKSMRNSKWKYLLLEIPSPIMKSRRKGQLKR